MQCSQRKNGKLKWQKKLNKISSLKIFFVSLFVLLLLQPFILNQPISQILFFQESCRTSEGFQEALPLF